MSAEPCGDAERKGRRATLTKPLPSDIIDHEPATGNVWKMILGSLDKEYDDTETMVGDDVSTANLRSEESYGDEPEGDAAVPSSSIKRSRSKGSRDVGHVGGAFDKLKQAQTFHGGSSSSSSASPSFSK